MTVTIGTFDIQTPQQHGKIAEETGGIGAALELRWFVACRMGESILVTVQHSFLHRLI